MKANKVHVQELLCSVGGLTREQARLVYQALKKSVYSGLDQGLSVQFPGLIALEVIDSKPGLRRNPATGEKFFVPMRKRPHVKISAGLKNRLSAAERRLILVFAPERWELEHALTESEELSGYDIDFADSAQDAARLLTEKNYQLLLLDGDIAARDYAALSLALKFREETVNPLLVVLSDVQDFCEGAEGVNIIPDFVIPEQVDEGFAARLSNLLAPLFHESRKVKRQIQWKFPSTQPNLETFKELFSSVLHQSLLSSEQFDQFQAAAGEALETAVVLANREDPLKTVLVEYLEDPEKVSLVVHDQRTLYRDAKPVSVDPMRRKILENYTDEYHMSEDGASCTLVKRLARPKAPAEK